MIGIDKEKFGKILSLREEVNEFLNLVDSRVRYILGEIAKMAKCKANVDKIEIYYTSDKGLDLWEQEFQERIVIHYLCNYPLKAVERVFGNDLCFNIPIKWLFEDFHEELQLQASNEVNFWRKKCSQKF